MKTAGTDSRFAWYVESSALVSSLLEQDEAAKQVIRQATKRISSVMTLAETCRAIVRARHSGRIDAPRMHRATRALATFAKRCSVVPVSRDILARAGRPFMVEPIRTLDAIHLATIELLGVEPGTIGI
jgi:predicted nucleic acid-binding protein